jgi:formylglycine-generating enzyme required for sulfatase activity
MERLRNRFLNVPVEAVLHSPSVSAQRVATEQKDKAAMVAPTIPLNDGTWAVIENAQLRQRYAAPFAQPADDVASAATRPADDVASAATRPADDVASAATRKDRQSPWQVWPIAVGAAGVTAVIALAWVLQLPRTSIEQPTVVNQASVTQLPNVPLSLDRERALKPKDTFRECSECPEMVVVPDGSFMMGSPTDEPERNGREVQVRVTIARPFAVGRFAVTFAEWNACVADGGCKGYRPNDEGWGRDRRPVINVNWDDAKLYIDWLNARTGKIYRLLSEAEREYVARAGTKTPFWWGAAITPKQANYDGSSGPYKGGGTKGEYRQRTVPVDSFEANPWGLFNVHGNVWEWTEDCWNDSNQGNPGNGSARTTGDCGGRVIRGGSWLQNPQSLRSANRSRGSADYRGSGQGFRLARTLNP